MSFAPTNSILHQTEVAFLGLAERAAAVHDGNTQLLKWSVIGLKHVVLVNFFPMSLAGWHLGLAIRNLNMESGVTLHVTRSDDTLLFDIKMKADYKTAPEEHEQKNIGEIASCPSIHAQYFPTTWNTFFLPLLNFRTVIDSPGQYFVKLISERDGMQHEEMIGEIYFVLVDPEPLSPERIAAIRSDPGAVKAARIDLGCNFCTKKYFVYAALDRTSSMEKDGYVWYQDIEEIFDCECG